MEQSSTIQALQDEVNAWADSVFPDRTLGSAMLKLYEELGELLRAPEDELEHADVYILLLDISALMKVDVEQAVRKKLAINRLREWRVTQVNTMQRHDPTTDAKNEKP